MTSGKLPFWVGFSKVPGIGPVRLQTLLDYFGDIEAAWQADPGEWRAMGLDRRAVESLAAMRKKLNLDAEMERLERLEVTVLTWESAAYPDLLKSINNAPPVLYIRGALAPPDEWAVAMVGTRRATTYGRECARLLAKGLAKNGVTVVSGLAYGIDTEAHQASLKAGGRTIAVLGCGVDVIYPADNRVLSQRIMEQGALISEFPLGTRPESSNFPRRNRIISGLSLGVVFVEGGIKSGARITTNYALEQGREVFAVPGSILKRSGAGANYLIQNGAKLVTDVADILEELSLTMVTQHAEARQIIPDNETEAALLRHLSTEPRHVDELGQATALPAAEIASALTMMELKGMVRHVGGMNYVIS